MAEPVNGILTQIEGLDNITQSLYGRENISEYDIEAIKNVKVQAQVSVAFKKLKEAESFVPKNIPTMIVSSAGREKLKNAEEVDRGGYGMALIIGDIFVKDIVKVGSTQKPKNVQALFIMKWDWWNKTPEWKYSYSNWFSFQYEDYYTEDGFSDKAFLKSNGLVYEVIGANFLNYTRRGRNYNYEVGFLPDVARKRSVYTAIQEIVSWNTSYLDRLKELYETKKAKGSLLESVKEFCKSINGDAVNWKYSMLDSNEIKNFGKHKKIYSNHFVNIDEEYDDEERERLTIEYPENTLEVESKDCFLYFVGINKPEQPFTLIRYIPKDATMNEIITEFIVKYIQ